MFSLSQQTWTILIGLLTIAFFLPAIGYEFAYDSYIQVGFDDFIHVHRHLWDVLTLRVLGMDVLDFNRPVNLVTLIFDSMLWGRDTPGYHLTSILFHAGAAMLLFQFLHRTTGSLLASGIATIFFAIHPLQAESVVEVGNREDVLATFFMLAALNFALAFRPSEYRGVKLWGTGVGVIVCGLLAVASKESGAALPPILLTYWLVFRRKEPVTPWIGLIVTTGAVSGGFLAARFILESQNSAIFAEKAQPIYHDLLGWLRIQSNIYAAEMFRIVWPFNLCADYNGYSLRNYTWWLSALGILSVIVLQVWGALRFRLVALGIAVFWFSLLPVSNLIPIYKPMADRFLDMPLAGVALMLTPLFGVVRRPATLAISALPLLGLLGMRGWTQEQVWQSRVSLWTDTVEKNPFSYNGWLGIGYSQLDANRLQEAAAGFQKAINGSQGKAA